MYLLCKGYTSVSLKEIKDKPSADEVLKVDSNPWLTTRTGRRRSERVRARGVEGRLQGKGDWKAVVATWATSRTTTANNKNKCQKNQRKCAIKAIFSVGIQPKPRTSPPHEIQRLHRENVWCVILSLSW